MSAPPNDEPRVQAGSGGAEKDERPTKNTIPPRLKPHPLALLIPAMLRDEYVEFVADIKAHGLRQPIMLYEGMILDGRHRDEACGELGIEPRFEIFTGTEAEAKAYVLSVNVHRRHLSLPQKEAIAFAELQRDPTQSDRTIAAKAKLSPTKAGKIRAKAEAAGMVSTVDTIVGKDGVKQPSAKPASTATKPTTALVPSFRGLPGSRHIPMFSDIHDPNPPKSRPTVSPGVKRDKTVTSTVLALDDGGMLRIARICVHALLERKKLKQRFSEADVATITQCHELLEAEIKKIETKLTENVKVTH